MYFDTFLSSVLRRSHSMSVSIRPVGCLMHRNWQLTLEYFSDIVGESVEPKDVFLAFTVDQGKNIVNACHALGVPVVECNCHRVNSAVLWALGIAGSATTCKNKEMGDLMKKLAALVGVFSHSAVNNDMLKAIQRLQADLHRVYELVRRNDTRCALSGCFSVSSKTLVLAVQRCRL